MSSTRTNIDLLETDFRTLFILNSNNRILNENEPVPSAGPQFWLARCSDGQVYGFHVDINDQTVDGIEHLIAGDPTTPDDSERCSKPLEYLALLRRGQSDPNYNFGLIYHLQHSLLYSTPTLAHLIYSNSANGKALQHAWPTIGLPTSLLDLGFRSAADIWPPWCAAFVRDEITSLAFCARLSAEGAELGLVTVEEFRGRGLAAAVTAGWTRHSELQGRELFFSMDVRNEASKRVAERLGLRRVGWSLRIY